MARRAYGSGSLLIRTTVQGTRVYHAQFRDRSGRQIKRRIGPVRTPHEPDGLTKAQAEARLRDLMNDEQIVAAPEHARTLDAAADAWFQHLEATGAKASSIRAYKAALAWFTPSLGDRSLDRITTSDVEHVMRLMRKKNRSDKTIRNYLGALSALFTFASDRKRRWTRHNPVADVDLPKKPTYVEIRYLTSDEVWSLVDHATPGDMQPLDRALYLTAAMTGLRIGELQALDWRSIDVLHSRVRVRRSWDRKTKTYTLPKSRRSERAVPMPDLVAGELERMWRHYHPDEKEPDPDALVFGHPMTGEPESWRQLYQRLRAALKAAGLDEHHGFHSLRHTYGTALAGQGIAMRTLMEFMGHNDISTTTRYADYAPNPRERDIVEAAFARGTIRGNILRAPEGTERNSEHQGSGPPPHHTPTQ